MFTHAMTRGYTPSLVSFILSFHLHLVRMFLLLLILTLLSGLLTSTQEPPHNAPSQRGNVTNGTTANITIEPGNIITTLIPKTTLIGKRNIIMQKIV